MNGRGERGGSGGDGAEAGADPIEMLAADADRWKDVTCVALLRGHDASGETLGAVQRLARSLRRHHSVFLLNLEGPGSGLDERLSAAGRPGLVSVRRGDRKVGEATVRPPGEQFLYLPAGSSAEASSSRPAADPAIVDLVGKLRSKLEETDWLLLVLLAPDETAALEGVLDGHVLLQPGIEVGPGAGPEIGRLEQEGELVAPPGGTRGADDVKGETRDEPEPSGADGADPGDVAPEESGEAAGEPPQWRRHRRREGPPVGGIVIAVLVVAALAGAWWWFAGRAGEAGAGARDAAGPGPTAAPDAFAAGAEAVADTSGDRSDTARSAEADGGSGAAADADGPDAPPAATELGYSVLVASYGDADVALGRAASWSGDGLYFTAPTPVADATYWRVYAGAFAAREAAEAFNLRLAEIGRKDTARAWDVRPVPLAFRLAGFATRAEADRRAAELRRAGLPAYVLAAAAGGDAAWQVYAGAYENEEDASMLRSRLAEAGVAAELVTRRGEPTGP